MHTYNIPLPFLILIRGIPGSGKSSIATQLSEALGNDNVTAIDPDMIDLNSTVYHNFTHELQQQGVDAKFHPYRYLRAQAHEAILDRKIIIWNQAFIDITGFTLTTDKLQAYATEHDLDLPIIVVEVEIDADIARRRIEERTSRGGHSVPSEKLEQFIREYRSFEEEGYVVVRVNGSEGISTSVATILARLDDPS